MNIALMKPIIAHGKETSELSLREPTGKDLRKTGVPFRVQPDGIPTYDTEACAKLISELAAIPSSSVDQLDALDFVRLCDALITPFFSPVSSQKTPSTDTGNSPSSTTTS